MLTLLCVIVSASLLFVVVHATRLTGRTLWGHPPGAVVILWLVVTAVSGAQLFVPGWYDALYRDPEAILHRGQLWRLVTAMLVQDGWAAGMAFNLVLLAVVAVPAARYLGGPAAVSVFLGTGITLNVLGTLFGSSGGGNSGATLALAGAVTGHAAAAVLTRRVRATTSAILPAVTPLVIGSLAVAVAEYHGLAVILGFGVGALMLLVRPGTFPRSNEVPG